MSAIQPHLRVVIGAGEFHNNPGWVHTQEGELSLLKKSDWEARFAPNSITSILAEHVWEHCGVAGILRRIRPVSRFELG